MMIVSLRICDQLKDEDYAGDYADYIGEKKDKPNYKAQANSLSTRIGLHIRYENDIRHKY